MRFLKRANAGFSLMELIVIIALLGLLSVALLVPIRKLTTYARTTTITSTNSSIQSTVALSILKYAATGDAQATQVQMLDKIIVVNPGSGIPIGTYPGIGAALNFPSASQANGLIIDYTQPTAVSFQLARNKNQNCSIIYNGSTGATSINASDC